MRPFPLSAPSSSIRPLQIRVFFPVLASDHGFPCSLILWPEDGGGMFHQKLINFYQVVRRNTPENHILILIWICSGTWTPFPSKRHMIFIFLCSDTVFVFLCVCVCVRVRACAPPRVQLSAIDEHLNVCNSLTSIIWTLYWCEILRWKTEFQMVELEVWAQLILKAGIWQNRDVVTSTSLLHLCPKWSEPLLIWFSHFPSSQLASPYRG